MYDEAMLALAVFTAAAMLCADPSPPAAGPAVALRAESEAQRSARHAAVAKARQGTILLAHRGAASFAPENSVDAIEAAMQIGCEAVKLDFRRTLDGVVVLYHDDRLENRLDMFGTVETSYYDELMLASLRDDNTPFQHYAGVIPTLDEVLEELRQRNGLVHVDVKTPGLSQTLLEAFRKADMLDHIIGYGTANSEAFQQAGIPQIAFKGSLLGTHRDLDPSCIKDVLAKPGQVVFLDDPRAALSLLGIKEKEYIPYAVPSTHEFSSSPCELNEYERVLAGRSNKFPLRVATARILRGYDDALPLLAQAPRLLRSPQAETRRAIARNLGQFARRDQKDSFHGVLQQHLVHLLDDPDVTVRAEAAVACVRARLQNAQFDNAGPQIVRLLDETLRTRPNSAAERGTMLDARGHYAFALGLLGERSKEASDVLMKAFRQRETGHNRMWLGVDGAMEAWALGQLGATEAVPLFREVLLWQPPPGVEAADDDEPPQAYVYWDLQAPRFLAHALVQIGTPEAMAVLQDILRLPPDLAGRGSPELLLRTAAAMAESKQPATIAELLMHKAPEVRGEAILQCFREPGRDYRRLLERHAAWSVPWWAVEYDEGW